jgi:aspartate racemase
MSWESTATYYRLINTAITEKLGGFHSARIAMVSVDFHEIELLQAAGDWETAGTTLADAARQAEAAGADMLLVCTNTMHKVADRIDQAITIPLLHIADATGEAIRSTGFTTVGLLGTRFTMEQEFYRARLQERFGLSILVPSAEDRREVDRIIYEELVRGVISSDSRARCLQIVDELHRRGAQGVIEGCTEIPLLVTAQHTPVPLFDTTSIHARRAVEMALEDS